MDGRQGARFLLPAATAYDMTRASEKQPAPAIPAVAMSTSDSLCRRGPRARGVIGRRVRVLSDPKVGRCKFYQMPHLTLRTMLVAVPYQCMQSCLHIINDTHSL